MTFTSDHDIFKEIGVRAEHPLFYSRIASFVTKKQTSSEQTLDRAIASICSEEYIDLSTRADRTKIQDSTAIRNVIKSRAIATILIDDDGEIRRELLPPFIEGMKTHLYSLAPGRSYDKVRDEHILQVLESLNSDKNLFRILRHISRPLSNRLAEQVIRDTLVVPHNIALTEAHVRRACLSAWLCYLRQSLGSCFATAPSILIQQEQPHRFLQDLDEMMNTGRMKRTYGGLEHTVPMSSTWGNGNLFFPFVMQANIRRDESKIWMAPGIIAAMEAIGLFEEEMSLQKKMQRVRKLLRESLPLLEKKGEVFITCAEEIIRALILHRYELTKRDIDDFLNRPKNMIYGGIMIHVPLSSKRASDKGDPYLSYTRDLETAKLAFKALSENALLKSWEFTLASFSEINLDFCRWNLYASLGINHDEVGGIGECLYKLISQKVEEANNYLKERQVDCDEVRAQMHYLEGRARQASTEKEINWVKMEYQSRQTELYNIEQLRQTAYEKASKIAGLNKFLIDHYDKKFRDYFQEVYDADLQEVSQANPFDDSPAGFRLIYKHGRANPSQWTPIRSLSEFVEALVSFFTLTEQELSSSGEVKGIETEFSHIITHLVSHVRSDYFMETAFFRTAKAHGVPCVVKPLEHLDKVEKKPWVYTSGGSMSILVSAYFRLEERPQEVSRWVENETELLAFFIDTIKQMPPIATKTFYKGSMRSLLIHSPTHAFLLKPGLEFFYTASNVDAYTYTWIKQNVLKPGVSALTSIYIEEEMMRDMLNTLKNEVPPDFRPRFKQLFSVLPFRLSPKDFRRFVVQTIYSDPGMRGPYGSVISCDEVDRIIFSHIPYIENRKVAEVCREILFPLFTKDRQESVAAFITNATRNMQGTSSISAKWLLEILKGVCIFVLGKTKTAVDVYQHILDELRHRHLLLPLPILVADSNWIRDYFAFVVSPATYELELWTTDFYGTEGRPISGWKIWVNGSRKDPKWGIFNKPQQYIA